MLIIGQGRAGNVRDSGWTSMLDLPKVKEKGLSSKSNLQCHVTSEFNGIYRATILWAQVNMWRKEPLVLSWTASINWRQLRSLSKGHDSLFWITVSNLPPGSATLSRRRTLKQQTNSADKILQINIPFGCNSHICGEIKRLVNNLTSADTSKSLEVLPNVLLPLGIRLSTKVPLWLFPINSLCFLPWRASRQPALYLHS